MRAQTGGSRPGDDPALMNVTMRNQLAAAASIIADKVKASPPPVRITAPADRLEMIFTLNKDMLN